MEIDELGRRLEGRSELGTEEKIDLVLDLLHELYGATRGIESQVRPLIDQISKHPMMKMLGVK